MSELPPRADRAEPVDLSVGAIVVYGGHGLGRVSARSPRAQGDAVEGTVIVEFSCGLSVILPLERARTCLRPLVIELNHVRAALRTREIELETPWQVRSRSARSKISAGEPVGLAEVIRDTVQRKRHFTGRTALSSAEHELYRKARDLLVAELEAAAEFNEGEADAWIEAQLNDPAESSDLVTTAVG